MFWAAFSYQTNTISSDATTWNSSSSKVLQVKQDQTIPEIFGCKNTNKWHISPALGSALQQHFRGAAKTWKKYRPHLFHAWCFVPHFNYKKFSRKVSQCWRCSVSCGSVKYDVFVLSINIVMAVLLHAQPCFYLIQFAFTQFAVGASTLYQFDRQSFHEQRCIFTAFVYCFVT